MHLRDAYKLTQCINISTWYVGHYKLAKMMVMPQRNTDNNQN